jgi:hypothetical protein
MIVRSGLMVGLDECEVGPDECEAWWLWVAGLMMIAVASDDCGVGPDNREVGPDNREVGPDAREVGPDDEVRWGLRTVRASLMTMT